MARFLNLLEEAPVVADHKISATEKQFQERFNRIRAEHALGLWDLARREASAGQATDAYALATDAAHDNRDFKPAWRFLGYVTYRDGWHTPFELKQLSRPGLASALRLAAGGTRGPL